MRIKTQTANSPLHFKIVCFNETRVTRMIKNFFFAFTQQFKINCSGINKIERRKNVTLNKTNECA